MPEIDDEPQDHLEEGNGGAHEMRSAPSTASGTSTDGGEPASKAPVTAVNVIDMMARRADIVMGEELSEFCKECQRWKFVKKYFVLCSIIWLVALAACFFLVGYIADANLLGKAQAYSTWLPLMGILTWVLVVLRFALALWFSPKASDATSSLVFLAAFVVLHLFTWQQVGTSVGSGILSSDYYRSYAALARRMRVPGKEDITCFEDIYEWLEEWVDEWLPETVDPSTELHPGWMTTLPPAVWTQRVRAQACDSMSFSGAACTQAGGLTRDGEMTSDWTLPWADGEMVLTHEQGDFLNFRGEKRESPVFSGKLSNFQFQRGYHIRLGDEPALGTQALTANHSASREIVSRMRNASFIDSYMRVMYVDTNFLHFYLGQWIILRAIFEQDAAGYIEPSLKVYQGAIPRCSLHDEAEQRAFLERLAGLPGGRPPACEDAGSCREVLAELGVQDGDYSCENVAVSDFWPVALAYFLGSAQLFYFPLSEGSGWYAAALVALTSFLLLEELQQMSLRGKRYFADVSNYFELMTIIAVYMMFGKSLEQQGATPQDGNSWNLFCTHIEALHSMCGFACFLWWMRLLNFVSNLHPRLRLLIHTLHNAWVDLSFFCAMFAIVLLAFAMSFHVWFSSSQPAFTNLWGSFVALFRGLIGDIKAGTFTDDWFTTIFYMAYIILSLLIMVNVFIAIISSSFEVQQAERRAEEAHRAQRREELEQWLESPPGEEAGDQPVDADVLKVVLWGGRNLRSTDLNGLADPHAVLGLCRRGDQVQLGGPQATASKTIALQVDGRHVAFEAPVAQTSVARGTLSPDWNHTAAFAVPRGATDSSLLELFVQVLDADLVKKDDCMGRACVPVFQLLDGSIGTQRTSKMNVVAGNGAEGRLARHALKVTLGTSSRSAGFVDVSAALHRSGASSAATAQAASGEGAPSKQFAAAAAPEPLAPGAASKQLASEGASTQLAWEADASSRQLAANLEGRRIDDCHDSRVRMAL